MFFINKQSRQGRVAAFIGPGFHKEQK